MLQYEYVTSGARCEEIAKHLMAQKYFTFDTETTGLDQHVDKVTLVSITDPQKKTFLIDTRENPKIFLPFKEPLESELVKKTGFNLNFDYRLVKGTFGIEMENLLDLMLGEYCLTQGLMKSGRDLESVTKRYINKERDKTLQTSFIGHTGAFSEAQLQYAAEDSYDLIDIAVAMTAVIRGKGNLINTWNIENRSLPAWADIVFYGQKIDDPAWRAIMADNEKALAAAKVDLDYHMEPVVDKYLDGRLAIDYESPKQLLIALRRLGLQVDEDAIEDTNKKTLKKLREFPVIQALMRYRTYQKALSTYGLSYLEEVHQKTGRIHPKVNQYGTESGRPTCNKPNILNIPREARYRNAFGTESGRLISTCDHSAAELRILADQSNDRTMVDGFNSGIDFHCFVASMLFNREVTKKNENAHLRTPTKELNFGIAYGMSPFSLFEKINGNGYKITLDDTEKLFNKYCDTFRTALSYLRNQGEIAKKDLFLQTSTGRMRYWRKPEWGTIYASLAKELGPRFDPNSYEGKRLAARKYESQLSAISREGGNMPIQSMNADMTKTAMYEIRRECKKRKYDVRMYNSVYDEIVLDTPESCAQEVHEIHKNLMKETANRFLTKVQMEVEGHLAKCWTK